MMKIKPAPYSLTDEHRAQLKPWADKWIANAMSTAAMTDEDRRICHEAVIGLYAAAGLKAPRVVFVPSPFVGAFTTGFASWIWHQRGYAATGAATYAATREATYAATDAATREATYAATDAATLAATYAATLAATRAATYAATDAATLVATLAATDLSCWYVIDGDMRACADALGVGQAGLDCAARSAWNQRQGGNQWSGWAAYISFFCHVARLGETHGIDYSKWDPWETLALHSGPRYLHPEFCIVSDRPELLTVDDRNRPHGERGPFCRWRDGSALYSWHGTRVPAAWVEQRDTLDPTLALTHPNIEERRAAAEIIGWHRVLDHVSARVVDTDVPDIGTLLEADLPDSPGSKFLRVMCATGREFVLPVPAEMKTALQANAWTYGLDGAEYAPEVRT